MLWNFSLSSKRKAIHEKKTMESSENSISFIHSRIIQMHIFTIKKSSSCCFLFPFSDGKHISMHLIEYNFSFSPEK